MTISTDAIICYGIQIGEEGNMPEIFCKGENDYRSYDDILIDAFEAPPKEQYQTPDIDKEQFKKWSKAHDARTNFQKELGLELVRHCHSDETMYCLAISKSVQVASRGYPKEITARTSDIQHDWNEKLAKAIKVLKLEDATPRWWLQSYWG